MKGERRHKMGSGACKGNTNNDKSTDSGNAERADNGERKLQNPDIPQEATETAETLGTESENQKKKKKGEGRRREQNQQKKDQREAITAVERGSRMVSGIGKGDNNDTGADDQKAERGHRDPENGKSRHGARRNGRRDGSSRCERNKEGRSRKEDGEKRRNRSNNWAITPPRRRNYKTARRNRHNARSYNVGTHRPDRE